MQPAVIIRFIGFWECFAEVTASDHIQCEPASCSKGPYINTCVNTCAAKEPRLRCPPVGRGREDLRRVLGAAGCVSAGGDVACGSGASGPMHAYLLFGGVGSDIALGGLLYLL